MIAGGLIADVIAVIGSTDVGSWVTSIGKKKSGETAECGVEPGAFLRRVGPPNATK
jgi:hypothetical protein